MYKLKTLLLGMVLIGFTSCDVLDQEPQQSLPAGSIETIGDMESLLVGTYDQVQGLNDGDTNSGQLIFLNDIITGDVNWVGSFTTYVQVAQHDMATANGSVADHWDGAYAAINSANIILDTVDGIEATDAEKNNIKGQALFIRALEYYYLVNYFALPWGATSDNSHPGVPLQLTPVTSQEDFSKPLRSTVAQVYQQILDDLEAAEGLITNTSPERATNDAVVALQARIALIQERWTDAADLAGQVVNLNSLSSDVSEYFRSELSDESIFEIQHTTQDVVDGANTSLSAVYNPSARGDIEITEQFITALEAIVTDGQQTLLDAANYVATDTRQSVLMSADSTYSLKYEDFFNGADNVPVLRQSEMILIRAEALVRDAATLADVPQEAYDLVNSLRTRAIVVEDTTTGAVVDNSMIEYSIADFTNKEELLDAVLLERRVELAFEGHRKTDLQRYREDVKGDAWNADVIVFPIPQSQMDANTDLQQNGAYD